MRLRHDPPDAWRLFRTTTIAAGAAWLVMLGMVGWLWLVADPGEDTGPLLYIVQLMTGLFGGAVVLHYPWGPRWAEANGARLNGRPAEAAAPPGPGAVGRGTHAAP